MILLDTLSPVLQQFAELFPSVFDRINLPLETLKKIEASTTGVQEIALALQAVINRYGPQVFQIGVLLGTKTSDGLEQNFSDELVKQEAGEGHPLRFHNTFLCNTYALRNIDISADNPQRKVQEYIVQRSMNDRELGKHAEFPKLTILNYLFYYVILIAMPELGKEYLGYELKIDGTIYLIEVTDELGRVFKVSHRVKNGAWYSDAYLVNEIIYPKGSVVLYFE